MTTQRQALNDEIDRLTAKTPARGPDTDVYEDMIIALGGDMTIAHEMRDRPVHYKGMQTKLSSDHRLLPPSILLPVAGSTRQRKQDQAEATLWAVLDWMLGYPEDETEWVLGRMKWGIDAWGIARSIAGDISDMRELTHEVPRSKVRAIALCLIQEIQSRRATCAAYHAMKKRAEGRGTTYTYYSNMTPPQWQRGSTTPPAG